jgi:periplasmic divalent cation tolerance protein
MPIDLAPPLRYTAPMSTTTTSASVNVILSTAASVEVAERIARALVEEGLVACVNIVPGIRSIYRWQGKVCDDAEVLLIAKVALARRAAALARLRELHPYEVPEGIAFEVVDGLPDYLAWVIE